MTWNLGLRGIVGLGMNWPTADRPGTGILEASKLDAMWPNPTFENLKPAAAPFGMEHWEAAGTSLTVDLAAKPYGDSSVILRCGKWTWRPGDWLGQKGAQ